MGASLKISRPVQGVGRVVATVDIVVVDDGILVSVRRSSTGLLGLSRHSLRCGTLLSPRACPGRGPAGSPSNNFAALLTVVVAGIDIDINSGGNCRHRRRFAGRRCRSGRIGWGSLGGLFSCCGGSSRLNRDGLGLWLVSVTVIVSGSFFDRRGGSSRSLTGDGLGNGYHGEVGDIGPFVEGVTQGTGGTEGAQKQ